MFNIVFVFGSFRFDCLRRNGKRDRFIQEDTQLPQRGEASQFYRLFWTCPTSWARHTSSIWAQFTILGP